MASEFLGGSADQRRYFKAASEVNSRYCAPHSPNELPIGRTIDCQNIMQKSGDNKTQIMRRGFGVALKSFASESMEGHRVFHHPTPP